MIFAFVYTTTTNSVLRCILSKVGNCIHRVKLESWRLGSSDQYQLSVTDNALYKGKLINVGKLVHSFSNY